MKVLESLGSDTARVMNENPKLGRMLKRKHLKHVAFYQGKSLPSRIVSRERGVLGAYDRQRAKVFVTVGSSTKSTRLTLGKWMVEKSVPGIARHELGHHIYYKCINKTARSKWAKLWNTYDERAFTKGVSKYGASSVEEGFAEAFNAFTHPKYGKGKRLPPRIEEFLEKLLR